MRRFFKICYELREFENGEELERIKVTETTMAGGEEEEEDGKTRGWDFCSWNDWIEEFSFTIGGRKVKLI